VPCHFCWEEGGGRREEGGERRRRKGRRKRRRGLSTRLNGPEKSVPPWVSIARRLWTMEKGMATLISLKHNNEMA